MRILTIPIFNSPIKVSPDALMAKAFRIRRFGRAELHKTYIQTQVQMKTDGRLNAFNRNGGRSLSNDNLPSPQVVDNITANSTTLTYKAVSQFNDSFKFHIFYGFIWKVEVKFLILKRCVSHFGPQGSTTKYIFQGIINISLITSWNVQKKSVYFVRLDEI